MTTSSAKNIDAYLEELPLEKRQVLQKLREQIMAFVPEAEELISYQMPGFRYRGKVFAGFAAFKKHYSFFPHSGSVLSQFKDQLEGFTWAKGTLQFTAEKPIPEGLLKRLLGARLIEIEEKFSKTKA